MPYYTRLLILSLLGTIATGCITQQPQNEAPTGVATSWCPTPRRIVLGIDVSMSYEIPAAAIEQSARLIERTACPGDQWFLRRIESDSYGPESHMFTATFSSLPPQPKKPTNPVGRKRHLQAMHEWQIEARSFAAERSAVAEELRGTTFEASDHSDLWGFVLKAEEILANTPEGYAPLLSDVDGS